MRDFRPDVIIEVAPATALLPSVRQCLDDRPPGSLAAPPACVPTLTRGADSTGVVPPGAGRPVPGGNAAGLRRPVPAGPPGQPPAAPAPQGRAADDEPVRRRHVLPEAGRVLGGPAARAADPRRPAALRGADERRGLPVAGRPPRAEHPDHAGGGLRRDDPAGARRRARALLAGRVPQALPADRQPGPAADRAGAAAGQPGAFSFRIISSSYEEGIPAVLHCAGKVRRLPAPTAAPGIDGIERSRFATRQFGGRRQFYDQMAAVIGEYFQYGPHFQVVHESLEDPRTKELLLDLRMGGALWRDSQRAGYLFPPALLDGGLQAFLCYMMQCSDVSAVPRRLEEFTVDRLPTSARLVCHYVPPAAAGLHERGQLAAAAWRARQRDADPVRRRHRRAGGPPGHATWAPSPTPAGRARPQQARDPLAAEERPRLDHRSAGRWSRAGHRSRAGDWSRAGGGPRARSRRRDQRRAASALTS